MVRLIGAIEAWSNKPTALPQRAPIFDFYCPRVALHDRLVATGKRFYCICFGPRCGSTLLCEDLRQWGIGVPTETFQSPLYPEPDGTTAEYIVRAVERLRAEGVGDSSDAFDLRSIFPDLRFVHVLRKDKVAQAISAWRAYASGIWHKSATEVDIDAGHFDYDFAAIREQLLQVLADDWVWSDHFESLEISRLQVLYEEYVKDRTTTLRSLSRFLDVQPAETELVDHLALMRDEWSSEMIKMTWADLHAPRQPIWTAYPA